MIIDLEPIEDERGSFARTFDADAFREQGLDARVVQCSTSFNQRRGTLRGMHLQVPPSAEGKLVRCTRGSLYDVALDLRKTSSSRRRWIAVELTAENRRMLYIPEGVAHGFQTLAGETEVFYQMTARYDANAARGVRWNDPAFGIEWPIANPILSARDRSLPDFALTEFA